MDQSGHRFGRVLLVIVWLASLSLPFLLNATVVFTVIYLSVVTVVTLAIAIPLLINGMARREQADLIGPDDRL